MSVGPSRSFAKAVRFANCSKPYEAVACTPISGDSASLLTLMVVMLQMIRQFQSTGLKETEKVENFLPRQDVQ